MNTADILNTLNKNSILFFYDKTGRFAGYLEALVNSRQFFTHNNEISEQRLPRTPVFILKNPVGDIVSFAKRDDLLLIVSDSSDDFSELISCAKGRTQGTVLCVIQTFLQY